MGSHELSIGRTLNPPDFGSECFAPSKEHCRRPHVPSSWRSSPPIHLGGGEKPELAHAACGLLAGSRLWGPVAQVVRAHA